MCCFMGDLGHETALSKGRLAWEAGRCEISSPFGKGQILTSSSGGEGNGIRHGIRSREKYVKGVRKR